jgi:hypothetical protein
VTLAEAIAAYSAALSKFNWAGLGVTVEIGEQPDGNGNWGFVKFTKGTFVFDMLIDRAGASGLTEEEFGYMMDSFIREAAIGVMAHEEPVQ